MLHQPRRIGLGKERCQYLERAKRVGNARRLDEVREERVSKAEDTESELGTETGNEDQDEDADEYMAAPPSEDMDPGDVEAL